jgi:hypothetical protein
MRLCVSAKVSLARITLQEGERLICTTSRCAYRLGRPARGARAGFLSSGVGGRAGGISKDWPLAGG